MPDTLGSRLRGARLARHLTQKTVAAKIGVERPTVTSWETNKDKPGRDALSRLAELYETTIDALMNGSDDILGDKTRPAQAPGLNLGKGSEVALARVAEPHYRAMPQNVPVLGTGAGSHEGDFILNGEISEYVRRPPGIASAPHVFALWVTGESMSPRFSEGDLIYVHPDRRPRIGDDVLIEMKATADGARPAFVKRLVKLNSAEVVVEQFNPPQTITYGRAAVERVYKILTTAELMGF